MKRQSHVTLVELGRGVNRAFISDTLVVFKHAAPVPNKSSEMLKSCAKVNDLFFNTSASSNKF